MTFEEEFRQVVERLYKEFPHSVSSSFPSSSDDVGIIPISSKYIYISN